MQTIKLNKDQIEDQIATFVASFKGAVMASMSAENKVYLSTIPIVKIEHSIYTLISQTAPHYENLKMNGDVQIIFAQDESEMKSAFLRKRLSYNVKHQFIESLDHIVDAFKVCHGDIIDMILGIDFLFVKLEIVNGKAIFGPGQAYFINENEKFVAQDDGTMETRKSMTKV